jgi:hypothetical protein
MPLGMRERFALAVACALLVSGRAEAQSAESPAVALDYQVDAAVSDCPSAVEMAGAIAQQLGYDPFVADPVAARHHVRAGIQRAGSGMEAHVEWVDAQGGSQGERRLRSESGECAEIARGLSFAIAVQIQLRAPAEAPPKAAAPAVTSVPTPSAPKPAPPSRPQRRSVVMIGAGVLAQHGLTPDLSPGLRVFGSLGNERLSLEVSTQATLPSQWQSSPGSRAASLSSRPGFTARELSVRLAPCVHYSIAGFCAVGMLGQLHVRGEGVDQVQSPSSLVGGAGVRAQLLWRAAPWFGALLHAEALVLATPREVLLNRQKVWATAPIVLAASLDLAAIFQ